jgi:hypothetical protein
MFLMTALVLALALPLPLGAQSAFQFIVSATDNAGVPVGDLKTDEVRMTENGAAAKVTKIEPFSLPVRLTITVDNSGDSRDALGHYRTGLTKLVEALPQDVEVTLISTAPQPRTVVRPTRDRAQILRGINGFAPEDGRPRFTDAMVEYSERLEKDMRDRKAADFLPVLLMISTTADEQSDLQIPAIEKAMKFLANRRTRVFAVVTSTKAGDATAAADINSNRQFLIASPIAKATGGRYEALAISSRLATLLPEMGEQIAALHRRHATQFRVTVERPGGATGALQNPQIAVERVGLTGAVSLDGFLP